MDDTVLGEGGLEPGQLLGGGAAADALIIMTKWKAYRSPNLTAMKAAMKTPAIFDGRNLYEPARMARLGFQYAGIGRNTH